MSIVTRDWARIETEVGGTLEAKRSASGREEVFRSLLEIARLLR